MNQVLLLSLLFLLCQVPCAGGKKPNILFIYTDKHNYKYIMNLLETNIEELYDLETDPEELVNLAFHKDYRDTLAQLRREAIAELRRTDCPFVDQLHADLGEQK